MIEKMDNEFSVRFDYKRKKQKEEKVN